MKAGQRIESIKLVPGFKYRIIHRRKKGEGDCIVECVEAKKDGGEFIVREGTLSGINDYYEPGDRLTVINNLADFYEI